MARDRDDLPRPAPDVIEDGIPATEEVPEELLRTGEDGSASTRKRSCWPT